MNFGDGPRCAPFSAADPPPLHIAPLTPSPLKPTPSLLRRYFALDQIMSRTGACTGVVAWNSMTAHPPFAARWVLAPRLWAAPMSPRPRAPCNRRRAACGARRPALQDMEFVQSIRRIYGAGCMITEVRMVRALPCQFESAFHGALCAVSQGSGSRDVVSRC